ncbi:MAG: DEAD/DEAH box helicase family protein, partial [Chlamydiota bacterium]
MNNYWIASVLLDEGLEKPLDYLIPDECQATIKKGMRVEVPLKNSKRNGYVLSIHQGPLLQKLKPLCKILSEEILSPDLFELGLWMAKYYATPLHKVFACMIPASVRHAIEPKKSIFLISLKSLEELKSLLPSFQKYKEQIKVIEYFISHPKGTFLQDLLEELPISKSPIDTLIKKKILQSQKTSEDILLEGDYFPSSAKTLTEEQKASFEKISSSLEKQKFETHLIYGITGSGKTEIYLQAIQKALDLKKTTIMLIPEIALTAQTIERFRSRFPEQTLAILHHKRSQG